MTAQRPDRHRAHRHLTSEEHALWRRVTKTVVAGRSVNLLAGPHASHVAATSKPTPPRSNVSKERPHGAPAPKTHRELLHARARIDLHGLRQQEAFEALLAFLERASAARLRDVIVITGKGSGASGDDFAAESGVLRRLVPLWLRTPKFAAMVRSFATCHPGRGGDGALEIRLRRRNRHVDES